jgi:hypothetical protein
MAELAKADIERYRSLDEERKNLQRQADAKEREAKPFKEKIRAYVEEKGGGDRTTTHYGYVLALIPQAGRVKWEDAYIAIAGAEAAATLRAEAEPTFRLTVEVAAPAA